MLLAPVLSRVTGRLFRASVHPKKSPSPPSFCHSSSPWRSRQGDDALPPPTSLDPKHLENSTVLGEVTIEGQTSFATSSFPAHEAERLEEARRNQKNSAKDGSPLPNPRDDSKSSVLLFPGQGAQFVGMGEDLLDVPNVKDMYDRASQILGYDLLHLCLNGPPMELDRTIHCQAAMVVTSLAAVEKLYHEEPHLVENCIKTAGFSVGEITALIFSGAMTFDDGECSLLS